MGENIPVDFKYYEPRRWRDRYFPQPLGGVTLPIVCLLVSFLTAICIPRIEYDWHFGNVDSGISNYLLVKSAEGLALQQEVDRGLQMLSPFLASVQVRSLAYPSRVPFYSPLLYWRSEVWVMPGNSENPAPVLPVDEVIALLRDIDLGPEHGPVVLAGDPDCGPLFGDSARLIFHDFKEREFRWSRVPLSALNILAIAAIPWSIIWIGVAAERSVTRYRQLGSWRARRRRAAGLCASCGYDLRGSLSCKCSECGCDCSI